MVESEPDNDQNGRNEAEGWLRGETNRIKCFMIISSIPEHLCDLEASVWELLELLRGRRVVGVGLVGAWCRRGRQDGS